MDRPAELFDRLTKWADLVEQAVAAGTWPGRLEVMSHLFDTNNAVSRIDPEGLWHRQRDIVDLIEMYLTHGDTEQSDAEDPRLM